MPLKIIRGDITQIKVDAIVNSADPKVLIGLGVDAAIHRAAGPKLFEARMVVGPLFTSEVAMTLGYELPAKHVIFTVGPVWENQIEIQKQQLIDCYRNALLLAKSYQLKSIAFPLISAGYYQCPQRISYDCAMIAMKHFLFHHAFDIYLVINHHISEIDTHLYEDLKWQIAYRRSYHHAQNEFDVDQWIMNHLPLTYDQTIDCGLSSIWIEDVLSKKRYPSKSEGWLIAVATKMNEIQAEYWMHTLGFELDDDSDLIILHCLKKGINAISTIDLALIQYGFPMLYKTHHKMTFSVL
jgi:O-acetyl-ADP-ribose deacetylase (regulator of RNase III)